MNCITYSTPPLAHPTSMSIYLLKDNNELGPLTTDELQALLDANCINKDQLVRLED